jgi:hypothetical protein
VWALVCGVAASASWSWTLEHVLRLFPLMLLAGPLLGMAWAASARTQVEQESTHPCPDRLAHESTLPLFAGLQSETSQARGWKGLALPYTLPGSESHRLAGWSSTAVAHWQTLWPHSGKSWMQLMLSSVFALGLAGSFGMRGLMLVLLSLATGIGSAASRGRRTSSSIVFPFVPLTVAWLLGHAAYGTVGLVSVVVAAASSMALSALVLHRQASTSSRALLLQVVSQAVAAAGLLFVRQPLVAAAVALLTTPQVLLSPLLCRHSDHMPAQKRYFDAVQLPLMINMLLTALAVGYPS